MRRHLLGLLLASLSLPAYAGDPDDDFLDEDEEDDEPAPAPTPTPSEPEPEEDLLGEDEDAEQTDTVDDEGRRQEDDLLEQDEDDNRDEILAEGTDNATLYKRQLASVKDLASDEEVMAWEGYLQKYPNSVYRERIEARIDELLSVEYREDRGGPGAAGVDPKRQEILFTHALALSNVNPRTRVHAAFQFGFPFYFAGEIDYEHALLRNVSVHGGVRGGYTGWGLDAGARYAFVKSAKDKLVATLSTDIRANFNPLMFQVRPQLALGKIFGPVQLIASIGAEIGTRKQESVALFGGAAVSYRAAKPIAIFVESAFYVRQLGRTNPITDESAVYAFNNIVFGMKFYPNLKNRIDDPLEISAGGHVPGATQYLQYYYGAVQAQGDFYLKPKN